MMCTEIFAPLLVAGMEALLVQWTSFTVAPKLLALDFAVTGMVLAAVVLPVSALLRRTPLRRLAAALPLPVAIAVYDLSRLRTEKVSFVGPTAIVLCLVLLAGGFALVRRAARKRDSPRAEMIIGHLLWAATAATWIAFHLGGRFISTSLALALLGATTAAQSVATMALTAGADSRGRRPVAAMLASLVVLIAAAAASYPLAPGILEPEHQPDDSRPSPAAGLPNVIVIVLDTVRADHLSLYGYEKPTSPELSKFAARAHVFPDAIANSNWSLPSHATLLTGLLPHQHGAHTAIALRPESGSRAVKPVQRSLPENLPTVAERLDAVGYDTAAVSANYLWVSASSGLLRGFRYVDDRPAALVAWEPFCGAYVRRKPLRSVIYERYAGWTTSKRDADRTVDAVGEFLRRRRGAPFLLLVNFMDGHTPYHSAFRAAEVPEIRDRFREVRWDGDNLESYDRSIAFLDHQLGRFFGELRARGLFDDSLIVVTSDHGEWFGASGRGAHGLDLSQSNVHIPFLIKMPGQTKGEVHDRAGQLADVAPTIFSAAGLPIPREFFGSVLGKHPRAVIAENYFSSGRIRPAPTPPPTLDDLDERLPTEWALFAGSWKLVRDASGRKRLYDLAADPGESADVASERAAIASRLDDQLAAVLPPEVFTSYRVPVADVPVSRVTLEKLKSLGYAQ